MNGVPNRLIYYVICAVRTVLNVSNMAAGRTTQRDGPRRGQPCCIGTEEKLTKLSEIRTDNPVL